MTQNSLQTMAERSRRLVEQAKLTVSEARMRSLALDALEAQLLGQCSDSARPFRHVIAKPGLQLICKLDKNQSSTKSQDGCDFLQSRKMNKPETGNAAQPSQDQDSSALMAQGLSIESAISSSFSSHPSHQAVRRLEEKGVAAFSHSVNPALSLESLTRLKEFSGTINLPLLFKGFIVDSYQIYEAKAGGASAVLLICGILSDKELSAFSALAENLGMSVVVEVHDENEARRALSAGARIIGIGNEDPCNSSIDFEKLARLREHIPSGFLCINDSEAQSPEDLDALSGMGVDAAFVSEALLQAE